MDRALSASSHQRFCAEFLPSQKASCLEKSVSEFVSTSDASSYLQGKYGVEIRVESVNKDNSNSWVRISHGLNKLVTDLIDNEYDDN